MTTGIVYQLTGMWTAELAVVSIWSLRQHYDGPITLFATDDCIDAARAIAADSRLRVDMQRTVLPKVGKRPHWVAKTFTYLLSPYDYTIYLDSDTVILDDPTPLFGNLVLAQCNAWRIRDDFRYPRSVRIQAKRFRGYSPVLEQMIGRMLDHNGYVVNNGMVSFARNHPLMRELHHLCIGLGHDRLHDEIAMQICLPAYDDVRWVDGRWNALVAYEQQWEERKIAHYHHKYYAYSDRSPDHGPETYRPHLLAALSANAAAMREWIGASRNTHLRSLLPAEFLAAA